MASLNIGSVADVPPVMTGAAAVVGVKSPRAAHRLVGLLESRGVRIVTQASPVRVDGDAVLLRDGTRVRHDIVVMATGLRPPPLATRSPLGGRAGFPVRATLQHGDHDDVYAVGDCADFLPMALPRIGVHGVRQGPVLLEARTNGAPAPTYRPQRKASSVLDPRGRYGARGARAVVVARTRQSRPQAPDRQALDGDVPNLR